MEKAKKFFEEVIKTDEAKALFAATEKPETDEARIAAYLEIAKKLNFELTVEDIIAYFKAAVAVSSELDDDELAQLTGGGDTCSSSYESGEFCWFSDSCDVIIQYYGNSSSDSESTSPNSMQACGKGSYSVGVGTKARAL